jgi:hypothetical protein
MILATLLLTMAGAGPVSEAELLAQLQAGKWLCANPDARAQTCSAIDKYRPAAGGGFVDIGEVLLSAAPAVTLEVMSIVRVENGAICGAVLLSDLQRGRVRVNGVPLPSGQNAQALASLAEQMKSLAGRKACETLRLEDGGLMKYGQVEGIAVAPAGKPVIWVGRDDGYKVAP